jgi:RNA polymerase sigma-70 factor (ECF subfamily)
MDERVASIEPFIPVLRRYAFALLRDREAADDLVQDCLERAVMHWPSRRGESNLRAWLFAILRNLFVSGLRRRARHGTMVGLDSLDETAVRTYESDHGPPLRDVLCALEALPEEQRSVLLLVGVEDLSYEEAAQVLGVPVGTIMSRLSRGREHMRRFLEVGQPPKLRSVK